jgi:hypothetical protein
MIFLFIMAIGLIGLILMALPGIQNHGHAAAGHLPAPHHGSIHLGHGGAHGASHALTGAHSGHAMPQTGQAGAPSQGSGSSAAAASGQQGASVGFEFARLIPSPRAIFSMLALFGAFGFALIPIVHSLVYAALIAILPAWAIEYFAVRPLWNLMFQFQGTPSSPMESLVLCDAKAVTPFRNGKGVVAVEKDGRLVQFSARLHSTHANVPVNVGDSLCVEEVDAANQRVLVTLK